MNKFDRIKANANFIQDVNSDVKKTQTITTKGQKQLTLEPNTLRNKERSRSKHGRNLITHLFVEELEAIELTVEKLGGPSGSNCVRQLILDKCKNVLNDEEYDRIISNKRNVMKTNKLVKN